MTFEWGIFLISGFKSIPAIFEYRRLCKMQGSSEANAPISRTPEFFEILFSMKSTVFKTSQLFSSSPTSIILEKPALQATRRHHELVKDNPLRRSVCRAFFISSFDFNT